MRRCYDAHERFASRTPHNNSPSGSVPSSVRKGRLLQPGGRATVGSPNYSRCSLLSSLTHHSPLHPHATMSNITPNSQSSPHPFLDAPPPRASFSSLPQELQSLICRMASEQDKAYWERLDKATPPELEAFALLPKCEATGKSLGMLSRVNKEVNALCAPLLFRVSFGSQGGGGVRSVLASDDSFV